MSGVGTFRTWRCRSANVRFVGKADIVQERPNDRFWTRSGHSEGVEFNDCGPLQLPSRKQRNLKGLELVQNRPGHQRRFAMPAAEMKDHVYKILELVGSSEKSIEDAIQNAITRASNTIREMKWFEVVQTRGHIESGSVRHYQVTLRVGFTLEG
jgi:dodecin